MIWRRNGGSGRQMVCLPVPPHFRRFKSKLTLCRTNAHGQRLCHDQVSRVGDAAVCESGRPEVFVTCVRLLIRRNRERDARGHSGPCPPAFTIVPSGAAKCIRPIKAHFRGISVGIAITMRSITFIFNACESLGGNQTKQSTYPSWHLPKSLSRNILS